MDNREKQIKRDLAVRLKTLREAKGLTQRELALNSDIDHSIIGKCERGESIPTPVNLGKIADGLEITLSELLKGI